MVGTEGVEPSRGIPHKFLRLARLPFRHIPIPQGLYHGAAASASRMGYGHMAVATSS